MSPCDAKERLQRSQGCKGNVPKFATLPRGWNELESIIPSPFTNRINVMLDSTSAKHTRAQSMFDTQSTTPLPGEPHERAAVVPGTIRKVLRSETHLIEEHLLRLDSDTRRRRFGHDVADSYIHDYALHAADYGNLTIGFFHDGDIHAIAEMHQGERAHEHAAEIAFSVERAFANQGVATRLMGRIIRSARNRGIRQLMLVCVTENLKMQAIARHYGADLQLEDGSIIAEIIPQRADYASISGEYLDDGLVFVQAALDLQSRLARMTA
jgi:RimJ/RimL family protein N-acetyltransferase